MTICKELSFFDFVAGNVNLDMFEEERRERSRIAV